MNNALKSVNKYLKQNFKCIEDVPTKALLGMYKRYRQSDHNLYCGCCGCITTPEDEEVHRSYMVVLGDLKEVLDTREHLPTAAERKAKRKLRAKQGRRK